MPKKRMCCASAKSVVADHIFDFTVVTEASEAEAWHWWTTYCDSARISTVMSHDATQKCTLQILVPTNPCVCIPSLAGAPPVQEAMHSCRFLGSRCTGDLRDPPAFHVAGHRPQADQQPRRCALTSSFLLLVAMPGAPSSVLALSSTARSP